MIEYMPDPRGSLVVYRRPNPHERYVMGVDAATGLGADFSCAQIVCTTYPFEQVAVLHCKQSVSDFSDSVNLLGRWYNNALALIEVNFPGNAVQDALITRCMYPNSYRAESHLDSDPGVSIRYGWQTTEASKWLLIRECQSLFQNDEVLVRDDKTLEELMNFVFIEDKTKTGGAPGFNDDRVMALMLALHGAKMEPVKRSERTETAAVDPQRAQMDALFNQFMARIHGRRDDGITL